MNKKLNSNSSAETAADSSTQPKLQRQAKLLANPMLCVCAFWKWLKELPYSTCQGCNKKGVHFLYEDHFGTGKNVYECKFCKTQYV